VRTAGPYFDELSVGDRFETAPAMELSSGAAALHQAIAGDRLALALDPALAERVTGDATPIAHPGLVWDVAIGQSTIATHRVIANLFYRGLVLRRFPRLGDVLHTVTEVVALKQTSKAGLAALRIRTVDQHDRAVLDFTRCAMLPRQGETDHADDLDAISAELSEDALRESWAGWDLTSVPATEIDEGDEWTLEGADVVSCATELARLTLNVAMAHHDRSVNPNGRRLVYGGHTIGIAAAQATRLLPNLVTIVGWHACDHLAPVFEDDDLRSTISVEARDGQLVHLRSRVRNGDDEDVLDWRFVAVIA
jgi:acyl dehydratase